MSSEVTTGELTRRERGKKSGVRRYPSLGLPVPYVTSGGEMQELTTAKSQGPISAEAAPRTSGTSEIDDEIAKRRGWVVFEYLGLICGKNAGARRCRAVKTYRSSVRGSSRRTQNPRFCTALHVVSRPAAALQCRRSQGH